MKPTDVRVVEAGLHFIPVETRVPLKFGTETLTSVVCARARVRVETRDGRVADGWGETPLSIQWIWPSATPYENRFAAVRRLAELGVTDWVDFHDPDHPIALGYDFLEHHLSRRLIALNEERATQGEEPIPWLAALVAMSPFDLAVHDAYGNALGIPTYATYTREHMSRDLGWWLEPAEGADVSFAGRYPADYLKAEPPRTLTAWHLVGGLDPIEASDLTGDEPDDGYPVLLREWIREDGLRAIKVKLRGNDFEWDYDRLVRVGRLALEEDVLWLSADFNCTVRDPKYVTEVLDRLLVEEPRIYAMILYVEQPFPYDLDAHKIDVRSVSARKPLFLDESAHDWRVVRLGRELGWSGVALKTCKTQTGALLSLAWARAHGMTLMVQDLTNPMIAQIPHVLLAAHAGTIQGVETNAMQFYPEASTFEAKVHPGLYRRRRGQVDLSTIRGPGFGYRLGEIARKLPQAAIEARV